MDEEDVFSDFEFDQAFVNDENVAPSPQVPTSMKDAMLNFSQRTQRATGISYDLGEENRPENDFEKLLLDYNCSLRSDNLDCQQICLDQGTTSELLQKLNKDMTNPEVNRRLVDSFAIAIGRQAKLQLYLSPCISSKGPQESIFRLLLSCIHTQTRIFDILLEKMEELAKSDDDGSKKLAVACVAQIRFLERIVDSSAMYKSIFDRDLENWTPAARDYLIEALPEVLTDVACQQDAAMTLRDMVLVKPSKEPLSYQTAIIGTLKLLRVDGDVARTIRKDLCRSIMQLEAAVLPELTSFLLQTLQFDDKSALRHVLEDLTSHLKLSSLRVDRANRRLGIDDILVAMFSKISRFVQLAGAKGWKEVSAFLRKGSQEGVDPDQTALDGVEAESGRIFDYFDVLLCLSLVSSDGCPPSILQIFKNQVTGHPEKFEDLKDCVNFALKFKKFSSRYLTPLIHLSQQLLWSSDQLLQELGAMIYRNLFITVAGARKNVLTTMLGHLSSSATEAEAILTSLEKLVKENYTEFEPFASEIKECLEHMDSLSYDNIKRLFSVLILIYTTSSKHDDIQKAVEQCLSRFLTSINEKEKIWGTLGTLMKLQHQLTTSSSTDRESKITKLLKILTEKCASTKLRSVMYTELAAILQDNIHSQKSPSILKWVENLFETFRSDFFVQKDGNYQGNSELESPKYVNKDCHLWLNTTSPRLIELVPLFKLLCGAAFLRQRWTHDEDDTQVAFSMHFTQLFFAFEANIMLDNVALEPGSNTTEIQKGADVLFHVIEWIREVLNAFHTCSTVECVDAEEMSALWIRKFRLLFICQERLQAAIRLAKEWPIPVVSSHYDKVLVLAEKTAAKRGRKVAPKKVPKKRKGNEEEGEQLEVAVKEEPASQEIPVRPMIFVEKCEKIQIPALLSRFRQLKLGTVVRCLQYLPDKRKTTCFLVQEFLKILRVVLPKKAGRVGPWAAKVEKVDPKFHGDSGQIWKLVTKGMCAVWFAMNTVVAQLRADFNDSNVVDRPAALLSQLSLLLKESLTVFSLALSCEEITEASSSSTERIRENRLRKRQVLMEKLEKTIIKCSSTSQRQATQDDPERSLLAYLISIAEIVPNIEVAVALVQAASSCTCWTDDLRKIMARITLDFLKKDWSDDEGEALKGAQMNGPVKVLLEKYISFRPAEYQLNCILWLLANKIAELVPDEERRKSQLSSYEEVGDPDLLTSDKNSLFYCFNRGTFGAIFKVFFTSLCNIIQKKLAPREMILVGAIEPAEIIKEWKIAGNIFCLLCLMLRVRELRSATVLTTAVKEGRRFLTLFAKNSSFMYILEDKTCFSSVSAEATAIIKCVQVGNRSLQNISVYAKTARSVSLLRTLPELRASSELWMRAVHSAMVNLGVQDAFEIGLLKSRDIDGEEIRDEEELNAADDTTIQEENESSSSEDISEVY